MSLTVYLYNPVEASGIFVKKGGELRGLTVSEVNEKYPEIVIKKYESDPVYRYNIAHNLWEMAHHAGLYEALLRPYRLRPHYIPDLLTEDEFEYLQTILAGELIPHIEKGLSRLKSDPDYFKKYNPENGWGNYEGLVKFAENYLKACKENPDAKVEVSR
jgi:hypothetical protein